MRLLSNSTGYGWASLRADIIIGIAIAILVWRMVEGDTFDDASAYVSAAIAAVVTVIDNIRRSREGQSSNGG